MKLTKADVAAIVLILVLTAWAVYVLIATNNVLPPSYPTKGAS